MRLDISRTTGNGWALRLRFTARVDGPCMRCLEPATPSSTSTPTRSTSPARATSLTSPYLADDDLDLEALGPRRARAGAAGPDHVLPGLRRPVPECGANLNEDPAHVHEAEPDPRWGKLSELTSSNRVLSFRPAMAVPKQKQSHARTAQRRAQHKITAPTVNGCPQCRQPRRPHRVCPHCGFYGGREVVHVHDHDHDHDH